MRSAWHRPLRYRVIVPLAMTIVALVAGIAVALTTFVLVDRHVESNAEAETHRLANTMARALVQPVLRNDVWQAYQLVRASTEVAPAASDAAVQIVVLDNEQQVFVSPTPRAFPIGLHASGLPRGMHEAARAVMTGSPPTAARVVQDDPPSLVLASPILGDEDELIGVVLATHPPGISATQRASVIGRLGVLGMVAIALVGLAGGLLGIHLTRPLARLREVMRDTPRRATVREQLESEELAHMALRGDEVGELARTFSGMLRQIAANQELERHMLEAERLASIGQLSAGIAHEVNNPLGGMLASIQNRRLRGAFDEATARTLDVLERGLHQVHETVQALLNEARSEQRPLRADDLHDLELLLRPEADHLGCRLQWAPGLPELMALPAVAVRQVVLNLSLNAIAAAGRRGEVRVWSVQDAQGWRVCVGNSGHALDAERLHALTSGAQRSSDGRLGLGLWITARILHTLGGELMLATEPPAGLATVLCARFPSPDALLLKRVPTPQGASGALDDLYAH
ncbi:MAG: hypothetical protein GTN84_14400 [Hydrogenophaga sp.]|uniref:sensor histidine kinase n=1 Tax=Hydrogenophaga sp. TaxID=1904254 RepID=UPI0016A393F7|nr:HAMP domain-containing sensor histidine kinase [Hydrogenophaga sp.]NIM42359.1 hypothetical protein [Hydrogenophaga sp.]NIN27514.1 hypothetical protein [Hydrogenophaga sp.]NIN32333.1 hypothetical protein [Hydrogenophaga sp.]NIN56567.1 hypothetical protein [Hydrogenophaga sp.]NIO52930.1 hypothetical protein [Hydrogenophaga sp.]